jgi:acyl-coenzyme A synthetase/AMP-(fatty) acid ligase
MWGDPDRFKQRYFPAELGGDVYLAGDGAIRDHAATIAFLAKGEQVTQDVSTLENPSVLDKLGEAF